MGGPVKPGHVARKVDRRDTNPICSLKHIEAAMKPVRLVLFGAAILLPTLANAAEVKVAVAANFTDAAKEIGALFERKTGLKAVFSFGATGQFFTQISQAAPFEVFLSADQATVTKAGAEGRAVSATQFTYAVGKLVMFSKGGEAAGGEKALKDGKFNKVAIANPAAAPYGAAAVEVMKAVGVYDALTPKIVQGQNITQTYQFVESGNAEIGFIALSQLIGDSGGSRWVVPQNLYTPIRQDAILLKAGAGNAAATEFLAFLKSPEAAQVKQKFGYGAE
jgi:molybdate transport system substrate-binding protein